MHDDVQLNRCSESTKQLYRDLKVKILSLGSDITIRQTRVYIGFKQKRTFVYVLTKVNYLQIVFCMPKGSLDHPEELTTDISEIGHLGHGDYGVKVENSKNFDSILSLIKQAYQYRK